MASALLAAGTACAGGAAGPAPPPQSPTYLLPARTVRPFETPLASATATSGKVTFTVMGVHSGEHYVIGTHADWPAKGMFVQLRLAAENTDNTFHDIRTDRLLLATADGGTHRTSSDAMRITRQPDDVFLGAGDRIEVDLWYDVPDGTRLRSLAVTTDAGPARDIALPPG
jgi:hypothetical protein